jgi:hypothetical protein
VISIYVILFIIVSFFLIKFVGSAILLLRSIAHPWAIEGRSPSSKAVATEEVNDRTSLGNRSLSHHAPKGARAPQSTDGPSCMSTIDRTYVRSSALRTECHSSPLPITFTTMCALDCFLVGVPTSFSRHVFLDTRLWVWYTHICSLRYSYTLNLIFQFCTYIRDNV